MPHLVRKQLMRYRNLFIRLCRIIRLIMCLGYIETFSRTAWDPTSSDKRGMSRPREDRIKYSRETQVMGLAVRTFADNTFSEIDFRRQRDQARRRYAVFAVHCVLFFTFGIGILH